MNDATRATLERLIDAADNREWHSSEDCRIEGRDRGGCHLCIVLAEARALLLMYSTPANESEP